MPRRIIYVWDADYPWDVRTEKTCLALTNAGHEVHIVARNKRWSPAREQLPEATIHRMPPIRSVGQRVDGILGFPAFFNPRWHRLLSRTIRETGADLIIVRDLPLCPMAIRVGHKHKIPVILDMAEHYPAIMREIWTSNRHRPIDYLVRNPRMVERVEQYCLSHADHILTVVEESSERLIELGVAPERLSIVGNTPSKERVTASPSKVLKQQGDTIDVVYLGLLEVSRGINELLDACILLRETSPKVRLLLVGNGRDEAMFRRRAVELGLNNDEVVFYGFVPYTDAMTIVANADIGVLPMHINEHMNTTVPNKLFDYMSVGLPVITSDSIPSMRIVNEMKSGEVFSAKDPASLASAIRRLADANVRQMKGEAGRQAILGHYNWENDIENLQMAVNTTQTSVR